MKRRQTAWVGAEISPNIRDLMDARRAETGVTIRWILECGICLYLQASEENVSTATLRKCKERDEKEQET